MAKLLSGTKIKVVYTLQLELTEVEAQALATMTKYGVDAFLKGYYTYLGKHYMEPYEAGIRSLFAAIEDQLDGDLYRLGKLKEAIKNNS